MREKTPDVLKVALLEYLGIERDPLERWQLAMSLVEGVVKRASTSDKVRACAIFAVSLLLRDWCYLCWVDLFYNPTTGTCIIIIFLRFCVCVVSW